MIEGLKPYPNAFQGTPMGDWLFARELQRESLIRQAINAIHQEACCSDPEYCVYAVCVTHPDCEGNDTLRTSLPDEDNVSEFFCFTCWEYFYASNP